MNKIDKYIRKLSPKDRSAILEILEQLSQGVIPGLDLKKLKGYENRFRVRKGTTRIIFHLDFNSHPIIESVERRNDNTY